MEFKLASDQEKLASTSAVRGVLHTIYKGRVSKVGKRRKEPRKYLPEAEEFEMPGCLCLASLEGYSAHTPTGAMRGAAKKGVTSAGEAADAPKLAGEMPGSENKACQTRQKLRELEVCMQQQAAL